MSWKYCGDQLKRWREKAGVTREQLSQASNYDIESVRSMEAGRRKPSLKLLQVADELCDAKGMLVGADAFLKPEKFPLGCVRRPRRPRPRRRPPGALRRRLHRSRTARRRVAGPGHHPGPLHHRSHRGAPAGRRPQPRGLHPPPPARQDAPGTPTPPARTSPHHRVHRLPHPLPSARPPGRPLPRLPWHPEGPATPPGPLPGQRPRTCRPSPSSTDHFTAIMNIHRPWR
ncbi:helix-turn-helix domain-containing protein [Kitasatospora sp. NPDC017646]|uniref:helix-turn-helix domain-containing protein n=1 Tax=Kitasatospora sp. NPDC017646 TaxID=3364024 RepID=UPI0037A80112